MGQACSVHGNTESLRTLDGKVWAGLFLLQKEAVTGSCEPDNEPTDSTKCVKFDSKRKY
jgi:hypothetical protein